MRRTAFRIWEVLDARFESAEARDIIKELTPRNPTRRDNLHIYAMSFFCIATLLFFIIYIFPSKVILDLREATL